MPKITWKGDKLLKKFEKNLERGIRVASSFLRKQVVRAINVPFRSRGGETIRHNPTRRGTPSKPGEPPRVDTGQLRRSIFMIVRKTGKGRVVGFVGTTLKYGKYLEYGTRRMAARPYLRTTLAKHRKRINRLITDHLSVSFSKKGDGRLRDAMTGRYIRGG